MNSFILNNKKSQSQVKRMLVGWDIDGTLFDSSHRCKIVDGKFDLDFWNKHCTEEYIFKDKPLPLLDIFYAYQAAGFTQVCVTARVLCDADYAFFKSHNLHFDAFLHREDSSSLDEVLKSKRLTEYLEENEMIPFAYWDDKQENLDVADSFGFRTFHASYMNEKLAKSKYQDIDFTPKEFT